MIDDKDPDLFFLLSKLGTLNERCDKLTNYNAILSSDVKRLTLSIMIQEHHRHLLMMSVGFSFFSASILVANFLFKFWS